MTQSTFNDDEISALVLDPGSIWTRAGLAGTETPQCVMSSSYGYIEERKDMRKFLFRDTDLLFPQDNVEIGNPIKDGIIDDWDACIEQWRYIFEKKLRVDTQEYPILVTEPSWNPPKNREKCMQVIIESLQAPGFFFAKQGLCAAFANNKSTALIVDVGGEMSSISPIYDGMVLRKGIMKQNLAGNAINQNIYNYLKANNISIYPQYMIEEKQIYKPDQEASPIFRQAKATKSFHKYHIDKLLNQFKENTCSFTDVPFHQSLMQARQPKPYEFPWGLHMTFGDERFAMCESLFDTSFKLINNNFEFEKGIVGLGQLTYQSISACEAEVRAAMLENIVVTGGTTLLPSFSRRLQNELSALLPGYRVMVQALGNPVERKSAAWLGASILASLNTMHQMWITKSEYEELGPERSALIEKRCKY